MTSKAEKDEIWRLLELFFKSNTMVSHLRDSFNDFILRKMDDIIEGFNPIEINHTFVPEINDYKFKIVIHIRNPIISKPTIVEKDGSTKIMTPFDARNRNFTYASNLYVDVHVSAAVLSEGAETEKTHTWTEESKKMSNVLLGKIPIMVKSKYCVLDDPGFLVNSSEECKYDDGGYFIVNGNEKIVVSQDRIAENKTYVFLNHKDTQYSHVAEIRSVQDNKFSVPKMTTLKFSSKPTQFGHYVRVSMHHVKQDLPIVIVFRALGVVTDKDIARLVFYESTHPLVDELVGSFEEGSHITSQRDAIDFIARHMSGIVPVQGMAESSVRKLQVDTVLSVLKNEFLPHVGASYEKKALYLASMMKKLISCYRGITPYDDRDSYVNKRIDPPGILMANLTRQYYGKVIKDMKNMIYKEIQNGSWKATNKFINVINKVNVSKIFKSTIIESGLKYGLATGNWGIKPGSNKQGVAQVLNRMTYNATLSHEKRINTPVEKKGRLVQPRKLHSTQFGVICPAETPEGVSVGLVKNMSVVSKVTVSSNSSSVRSCLASEAEVNPDNFSIYKTYSDAKIFADPDAVKVIVNGDIVGAHKDPRPFFEKLKGMKRSGAFHATTSVSWNVRVGEIWICTEGGRCVRPVIIVDPGNQSRLHRLVDASGGGSKEKEKASSWIDAVTGLEIVEYIDVEESDNSMIAMTLEDLKKGAKGFSHAIKYTHHELHASMMFGVLASLIPFSDHNQAPRNCYQAAMGKQAIGLYTSNYRKRYDTLGHVLNYPQKSIVQTRAAKVVNSDEMPCGNNVIVAIMTYTGYNQEDSVMLNASAVERGLFGSTHYRTYKEQNNKNHSTGEEEYFCNPAHEPSLKTLKPFNYKKLASDGFVPENTYVESGDVVIGKCMPIKSGLSLSCKDTSVVVKNNESGFVDRICNHDPSHINVNGDGYLFTKVRIRSDRVPTIGDKFCVPADTEVLTDHGWLFINDVTLINRVLQLDPETQEASFEKVQSVCGFRCDPEDSLIHVLGPSIDLLVTEDHKMCVSDSVFAPSASATDPVPRTKTDKYVLKKARDLTGMEWYGKSGKIVLCEPEGENKGTKEREENEDMAFLYGLFKRAGVLSYHNIIPSAMLRINQNKSKEVIEILRDRGISYLADDNEILIYSKTILDFFKRVQNYVGVEPWVFVNPSFAKSFLDGYFSCSFSSSSMENKKKESIDVSEDMANAIQLLALVADYKFAIDITRGSGENKRWFTIHTVDRMTNDYEIKNVNAFDQGIRMVYCVEVPSHVFLARRNGKCVWTGNSSRHGQKGTVGMMYKQADMPFTKDGIVPDIIVNPHAIPSRMTIAQLMECVMGKACVAHGCYGDATPFTDCSVQDIAEAMMKGGLEKHGDEVMYNPRTGEQMPTAIFIGPTYYQRLKHMVIDKIHGRSQNGPVVGLTRQPAEGRARDGGLRLGEMEVECNEAHGISSFLKERIMECSDNYRVYVCCKCGMIANVNPDVNIYECKPCNNNIAFHEIRIPYACKLMFQEIQTMSIGTSFIT